MLSYLPNNTA